MDAKIETAVCSHKAWPLSCTCKKVMPAAHTPAATGLMTCPSQLNHACTFASPPALCFQGPVPSAPEVLLDTGVRLAEGCRAEPLLNVPLCIANISGSGMEASTASRVKGVSHWLARGLKVSETALRPRCHVRCHLQAWCHAVRPGATEPRQGAHRDGEHVGRIGVWVG